MVPSVVATLTSGAGPAHVISRASMPHLSGPLIVEDLDPRIAEGPGERIEPRTQRGRRAADAHMKRSRWCQVHGVHFMGGAAQRRERGQRRRQRAARDLHRRRGEGPWKDLEGDLDQHAEPSEAAEEQMMQVEAGRILDDAAAAADEASFAIDETRADEEVPHAAVVEASRTVQSRGDRPTERRAASGERRLEGQALTVFGEQGLDGVDPRPGQCRERALVGLILEHAGQLRRSSRTSAGSTPESAVLVPPPTGLSTGPSPAAPGAA